MRSCSILINIYRNLNRIEIYKYCFVFLNYFNFPPSSKKPIIEKRERNENRKREIEKRRERAARKHVNDRERNFPGRKAERWKKAGEKSGNGSFCKSE